MNSTTKQSITQIDIKIVIDPGCPWCVIGSKRLGKAMDTARERGFTFRVKYLPFMVHPEFLEEGMPTVDYVINRIGKESYASLRDLMRPLGKEIGIDWAVDRGKGVLTSSLPSLCLIDWAWEQGLKTSEEEAQRLQGIVVDRIFRMYHEDGENFSDPPLLRSAAALAGLEADVAEEHFTSTAAKNRITKSIASCPYIGSSGGKGVPIFSFNDQFIVTGAQDTQDFLQIFDRAAIQS